MGQLHTATVFIVIANLLMWWASIAMLDLNPAGGTCYTLDGSILSQELSGITNYTTTENDVLNDLPSGDTGTVTSGGTNVFVDSFRAVIGWAQTAPGIKYAYGVAAAPYNLLKCTGLPPAFTAGIGALWYLTTFLILIAFLLGGRN